MKFDEIVSPTMKEMFIKQIENKILSGELKPGDKLPTERELAQQMKVGRSITNAGLVELQRKGFVDIRPRQGTFVADYKRDGTLEALTAIMHFNGGKFDKHTFDSLMDFRRMMIVECTYRAALNRTEEDLAALEENYSQLLECDTVHDAGWLKLEHEYLLTYASGNIVLPIVLKSFHEISVGFFQTIYQCLGPEYAKEGVRETIDFIRDKKADEAKEHIRLNMDIRINELTTAYYG